jgi:hypothetical protein
MEELRRLRKAREGLLVFLGWRRKRKTIEAASSTAP